MLIPPYLTGEETEAHSALGSAPHLVLHMSVNLGHWHISLRLPGGSERHSPVEEVGLVLGVSSWVGSRNSGNRDFKD